MFFSKKLEKTSSVLLFLQFFFFSFSVLFFFFFQKVCVTNPFIFELFLEFFVNPFFSLHIFLTKKSAQTPSFFVSAQSLCCFTFAFNIFPYFLSSLFLSSFFLPFYLFIPFCFSPLFLFSPFSILYFSISVFLFLFFLYLMFTHFFFSIAVVAYPLFVLTHFSSVSLFWSWSLCFLASSHFFFLHHRLCFFSKKNQIFLWSIFWRRNSVFIFWTLPLSVLNLVCFSSLRRHFSLFVLCFLLLRFFIVTFLDHRYFSWFSFINLLFGPLKKNSFCFVGKFKHIILLSMSFLWKYLVSLCFCPKENLWKVIDSLYFFSWLLPDSFSLYVYYRYVYPPCCSSSCWQKNWSKKKLVFYYYPSHIFQKKTAKT